MRKCREVERARMVEVSIGAARGSAAIVGQWLLSLCTGHVSHLLRGGCRSLAIILLTQGLDICNGCTQQSVGATPKQAD